MFKQNVSIFVERVKRYGKANIMVDGDKLHIKSISDGAIMETFDILETVSSTESRIWAWDIPDIIKGTDARLRLVAQLGCGCGGIPPYAIDEGYSGNS